jgi:multicomponent Na+:H+ antiporter subunit G
MNDLRLAVIVALLVGGVFFTFVSAVGVIRLPDVYSRAHTASQTDTLGAGLIVGAVVLAYGFESEVIKAVLLLVFIFITNPTAAHAVARAAYEEGIEPWTEGEERR